MNSLLFVKYFVHVISDLFHINKKTTFIFISHPAISTPNHLLQEPGNMKKDMATVSLCKTLNKFNKALTFKGLSKNSSMRMLCIFTMTVLTVVMLRKKLPDTTQIHILRFS